MKYAKAENGRLWHRPEDFGKFRYQNNEIHYTTKIVVYTNCPSHGFYLGELVKKCNLPQNALLCKHCFPKERK